MKKYNSIIFICIGIIGFIPWYYLTFYYEVWDSLGTAITSFILYLAFLAAVFYGLETRWLREETARRPYPSLLYDKESNSIHLKNYGEGSARNLVVKHANEVERIPLLSGFTAQRGGVAEKLIISYKVNDKYVIEYKDINDKRRRKVYLIADSNSHDGFWLKD